MHGQIDVILHEIDCAADHLLCLHEVGSDPAGFIRSQESCRNRGPRHEVLEILAILRNVRQFLEICPVVSGRFVFFDINFAEAILRLGEKVGHSRRKPCAVLRDSKIGSQSRTHRKILGPYGTGKNAASFG